MTDSTAADDPVTPDTGNETLGRPAETVAEVEGALLSRWPETRLEPSLDRITALMEVLGDPHRGYPAIHLTGTNGKTSTSRMVDTILTELEVRTGRFTSPHVQRVAERICLDNEVMSDEAFVAAFNDIAPYLWMVDADQPHPLSFFETMVGMAYAAFADTPVEAAIVEVGMGGAWDATNVIDADVAVVTPIAVDHAKYLGSTPAAIAAEKAGIIKAGSTVVIAEQRPEVAEVLAARVAEVGATALWEGEDFEMIATATAVGGQVVSLQSRRARYDDLVLPLYGAHQARNAVLAIAAVESFLGQGPIDGDLIASAVAKFTSPGRLEVVRRSPTIVLDAAHNPHGATAAAQALDTEFGFDPLIGVIGTMADKDYTGVLEAFEPVLAEVICTQNSTDRALAADTLGEAAREVFGEDRVRVIRDLGDAIDAAATAAEASQAEGNPLGAGGVLVTGSVITVGEARAMLVREPRRVGSE